MKPLIQAAEIWVPDAEASLLEFGGGLYDSAVEFGAISRSMCFGRTEGLPGRVWDEGRPILLTDLQSGYFRRAAAARKAGLVCALAFPTYLAERLQAVVVLYCGGPQADAGAVELWRNDPRVTTDMTLVEGYYGATVPDFAAATRETYLPREVGLPGLAWQRQASVFVDGLGDTPKFVRSEAAGAAGIQCGLALPCPVPGLSNYVLALLGSRTMPVARRVECWAMASGEGFGLQRLYGHDEQDGALPTGEQAITGGDFADGVASVLANAGPRVLKPFGEMSRGCLILPIASDGLVAEAVALHF